MAMKKLVIIMIISNAVCNTHIYSMKRPAETELSAPSFKHRSSFPKTGTFITQDYYTRLGLANDDIENVTQSQIADACIATKQRIQDEGRQDLIKYVDIACNTLSNPKTKQAYDFDLKATRQRLKTGAFIAQDYYTRLGLANNDIENVTQSQIADACIATKQRMQDEDQQDLIKYVDIACSTLSNPKAKQAYDFNLKAIKQQILSKIKQSKAMRKKSAKQMPKLTVSIPIITTYKKYNNYRKLGFAKANSYANITQDQIDVAYRRRLKRVQDPMIIQELNNAYHILSDPKLRQEYDKEMKEAEMREEQESRSFPSKKRFRTKSYDQRLGLPQRSKNITQSQIDAAYNAQRQKMIEEMRQDLFEDLDVAYKNLSYRAAKSSQAEMQEEYGQPIESEVEPQEPASPISLQELELRAGNPEYSLDDFMFEHLNEDDFGASTFEPQTTQEMPHMLSE